MKPGCRLLDLCCGEGFYTHRFYSGRAGSIVALDNNPKAISRARRNFRAPNIEYICGDIRTEMPQGPFDNISWDAGIEYFTHEEIAAIVASIKARLMPDGILNGYSVLAPQDAGRQMNSLGQKFGATSREELGEVFHKSFRNVTILRTTHADRFQSRTNHYFFASDGPLPFGEGWPDLQHWCSHEISARDKG
jgi:cyclopropane fatty-acyl-phospholipid synthase-like methyltransferase